MIKRSVHVFASSCTTSLGQILSVLSRETGTLHSLKPEKVRILRQPESEPSPIGNYCTDDWDKNFSFLGAR